MQSLFSRPINFNVPVELYPNHIKCLAIEHVEQTKMGVMVPNIALVPISLLPLPFCTEAQDGAPVVGVSTASTPLFFANRSPSFP